jgi:hypothetical protein
MYINVVHHQKIHYKTPPITLILKYIYNFSYFVMWFFWHKYTSYVEVCKCSLERLHKQKFTSFLVDVLLDVVQTCPCSYVGPVIGALLLTRPSTPSFCLSSAHFLTTLCIQFGIPQYCNCASFTMSVWSYHRWFQYPFATLPMWEWVHCNPWHVLRCCWNFCIEKWSSCIVKGFSFFPPATHEGEWILSSPLTIFEP